jgi:hypothetical protein
MSKKANGEGHKKKQKELKSIKNNQAVQLAQLLYDTYKGRESTHQKKEKQL